MLNLHFDRRMSEQTRRSCWVLPTVITVPHVATAKGQPAGSPTASHSPDGNGAEICWDHPEFQQSLGVCDLLENKPSMISINFLWFLKKFYFTPLFFLFTPSQSPVRVPNPQAAPATHRARSTSPRSLRSTSAPLWASTRRWSCAASCARRRCAAARWPKSSEAAWHMPLRWGLVVGR